MATFHEPKRGFTHISRQVLLSIVDQDGEKREERKQREKEREKMKKMKKEEEKRERKKSEGKHKSSRAAKAKTDAYLTKATPVNKHETERN